MQLPQTPPKYKDLLQELGKMSGERLVEIISIHVPPDPNNNYYHWDKLRHLKNHPKQLNAKEWWFRIKTARQSLYQNIPHTDKYKKPFVFCEPKNMLKLLHEIDLHGGGEIKSTAQIANPATRESYLINSLIEEAITSSQLEGAATTRKVAKEMLREKRKPRNRSELMIANNYRAMEFIKDVASEDLSPEIILELQGILTIGTLDNEHAVGAWRASDDFHVGDERDATILHEPPIHNEIPHRMKSLCKFANSKGSDEFLHPVVRATILHFLLAYDHPFEDGNGRTARALFYWSMLRQGYWTMEYVSISRILKTAPVQYARSYLYTETDDNDVTYFILHQLKVILKAIRELLGYLQKKSEERREMEVIIENSSELRSKLNHRQISVLNRALKHPNSVFTIESHKGAHNVTYDTARTDLLKLEALSLLRKTKRGKAFVFFPAPDFHKTLKSM